MKTHTKLTPSFGKTQCNDFIAAIHMQYLRMLLYVRMQVKVTIHKQSTIQCHTYIHKYVRA